METKQQQRMTVRSLKKEFLSLHTLEQKIIISEQVLSKVEEMEEFRSARVVLAYNSLPDELYTSLFLNRWYKQKMLLLPKVVDDHLTLHPYLGPQSVSVGAFGIEEPNTPLFLDYSKIDMALIPGMAFDSEGGRLGRGRGFYDRLLGKCLSERTLLVGVCFEFQLLHHVVTEANDIHMDFVVC